MVSNSMVLSCRKAPWFPIPWSFALYGSPVKRIGPTGLPTFCTLHAQADPAVVAGDFNLLLDELQSLWPALSGRITAIPETSVATSKPAIDGHPKPAINQRRSGQGFLLLHS